MFQPKRGETSNSILSRFELVREQSLAEAGLALSWVGYSFLLLRAIGTPVRIWATMLTPLGGVLPTTFGGLEQLKTLIRQSEHMRNTSMKGLWRRPRSQMHGSHAGRG